MGWLIALAVVVLLAMLPLGVSARYDDGGTRVRILAGPVRLTVYPMKKREKKPQKEKEKPGKTPEAAQPQPGQKKGGSLKDFWPLLDILFDMLGDFHRKLRVSRLELKLILAGDDPCDLAVTYGRTWAAVGNLMPRLERLLVIKKRDVQVECDFTASQTKIYGVLELTITLGRLTVMAVRYGFRALRQLLKIRNKQQKAVPKYESESS